MTATLTYRAQIVAGNSNDPIAVESTFDGLMGKIRRALRGTNGHAIVTAIDLQSQVCVDRYYVYCGGRFMRKMEPIR